MLYLNPKELISFGITCRRLHEVSESDTVWAPLVKQRSNVQRCVVILSNVKTRGFWKSRFFQDQVFGTISDAVKMARPGGMYSTNVQIDNNQNIKKMKIPLQLHLVNMLKRC